MDRYLLEEFLYEMDDEEFNDILNIVKNLAQEYVEKDGNNKITYNYYPQEERITVGSWRRKRKWLNKDK